MFAWLRRCLVMRFFMLHLWNYAFFFWSKLLFFNNWWFLLFNVIRYTIMVLVDFLIVRYAVMIWVCWFLRNNWSSLIRSLVVFFNYGLMGGIFTSWWLWCWFRSLTGRRLGRWLWGLFRCFSLWCILVYWIFLMHRLFMDRLVMLRNHALSLRFLMSNWLSLAFYN